MAVFYVKLIIRCIIAVALGIYLYRDSRSRDFHWTNWVITPALVIFPMFNLVISLAVAIIILGLYLAIRPKGLLYPCPHCKRKVHPILAFCPFCNKQVKKECLKCHDTVDWNATHCPHCNSTNLTES
ncbi:MAG TPA: zinc ribbon domain-containing protein [Firmicutes bacterium]|jgi:RNA polymerase subunit RPABC4/transcription elongation factor Spt4|nr:zinc ribbon domain-containing protein [Bacillota bacterium]